MSSAEGVRQRITVPLRSQRSVDERIALRFSRGRELLLRPLWSLSPRSRLRRAALRRFVVRGFQALNRGDFEAAFSIYDPQVELVSDARLIALGFDPVYRGRSERVGFQERWVAEWGDFQFAPEELTDLGDGRLFVRGRMVGSGLSSGAEFDSDWAVLLTIEGTRVVREQFFFNRADALEAAGLPD